MAGTRAIEREKTADVGLCSGLVFALDLLEEWVNADPASVEAKSPAREGVEQPSNLECRYRLGCWVLLVE
jgi:hypothetical protein